MPTDSDKHVNTEALVHIVNLVDVDNENADFYDGRFTISGWSFTA